MISHYYNSLTTPKLQQTHSKLEQAMSSLMKNYENTYQSDFFNFLKTIPAEQIVRFFYDYDDQIRVVNIPLTPEEQTTFLLKTIYSYESREANYLHCMINAFQYLLWVLKNKPVQTAEDFTDFVITLHFKCLQFLNGGTVYHKEAKQEQEIHQTRLLDFRHGNHAYVSSSFNSLNASRQVLNEYYSKKQPWLRIKLLKHDISMGEAYEYELNEVHPLSTSAEIEELANKFYVFKTQLWFKSCSSALNPYLRLMDRYQVVKNSYNEFKAEFLTAKNPIEKFILIDGFTQFLSQYHAFKDGNDRAFITLLSLYLTAHYKLPPSVLLTPSILRNFAPVEHLEQRIYGMSQVNSFKNFTSLQPMVQEIKQAVPTVGSAFDKLNHVIQSALKNSVSENSFDLGNEFHKHAIRQLKNYLLKERPWRLSLFGGKKYVSKKVKINVPEKIHQQLAAIDDSGVNANFVKRDWRAAWQSILKIGNNAFQESKSKDKHRKNYYELFSNTNSIEKLCEAIIVNPEMLKPRI